MAHAVIFSGMNDRAAFRGISRPLGPYRIASELEKHGFDCQVIDFIPWLKKEDVLAILDRHLGPETLWVGFSGSFFTDYSSGDSLAIRNGLDLERMYAFLDPTTIDAVFDMVRTKSTAKLVYGGTNIRVDNRIDYYFLGYSDVMIVKFTQELANNTLNFKIRIPAGCGYAAYLSRHPLHLDWHDYPEPDPKVLRNHWWRKDFNVLPGEGVPIELARGCIFKCKFCTMQLMGKKPGTYTLDFGTLKEDLVRAYETNGIESYYIVDDTLNDDVGKMRELHSIFTALPFKPKFSAYVRLDLLDRFPEVIDLLEESGIVGAFFGIESLNYESAKASGKGLHPDKVLARLYDLKSRWDGKVNVLASFILGLPGDTHEYLKWFTDWITGVKDLPFQDFGVAALRMSNPSAENAHEFSKHPEKYGYTLNSDLTWVSNKGVTWDECFELQKEIIKSKKNCRPGGFQVTDVTNLGIPFSDVLTTPALDLYMKYDIEKMHADRIRQYRDLLLA